MIIKFNEPFYFEDVKITPDTFGLDIFFKLEINEEKYAIPLCKIYDHDLEEKILNTIKIIKNNMENES